MSVDNLHKSFIEKFDLIIYLTLMLNIWLTKIGLNLLKTFTFQSLFE